MSEPKNGDVYCLDGYGYGDEAFFLVMVCAENVFSDGSGYEVFVLLDERGDYDTGDKFSTLLLPFNGWRRFA